ncbi:hypothetical protein HBH98_035830 [Parastagonospora nodorum]|nr:hypothetical protein HBH53_010840 [Parastagonospora nodorum]KAH3986319.1 hypothetical protein HBH52_042040 [Parastagonospora nodorum]KAH3988183.1 hypothetical protein HBH51_006990 [Parastagonospora nodorum]KAH4040151.1 hypothetical protein HBI09_024390 [Parastagonospora nodorum]KAH4071531.1 hypothetical protein HBH50_081850 [Parastagonospora nodorum]
MLLTTLTSLLLLSFASADDTTQYTSDDQFESTILNITNSYRQQHNATSLSWNSTLASFASDHSSDCKFAHSGGPYGENLASGYPNVTSSIKAWGHERTQYDFQKGDFDTVTGHFSQLVWKGTEQVGCGRTNCTGKGDAPGWFLVCEYYPGGNVLGQFKENVQSQIMGAVGDVPDDRGAAGGLGVTRGWVVLVGVVSLLVV